MHLFGSPRLTVYVVALYVALLIAVKVGSTYIRSDALARSVMSMLGSWSSCWVLEARDAIDNKLARP